MLVRQWAVSFPDRQASFKEIAEWTGANEEFISEKIGIRNRFFLGPGETVSDLAAKACRRLFEREELRPEDVELLILVTQNPDYPLPHTSAFIQNALELPSTCACFDVGLGCSGYAYGLSIAKGFMDAQGLKNGLLVTCDPYSKIMKRSDKNTVVIFGDAASVTWISSEAGGRIGLGDFGTDGAEAPSLIVPAGGSARPAGGIWREEPEQFRFEDVQLYMNGRAIYKFMMRRVPTSISACLDKNGLNPEDIDLFVLHQASRHMVDALRNKLKLPPEKVPLVIQDCGNTVSSTLPIVLDELNRTGRLQGQKVLISGFGVGLSWGTNILFFD